MENLIGQVEAMSATIQKLEADKEQLERDLMIAQAAANWLADELCGDHKG
jgi:hypothetical protein